MFAGGIGLYASQQTSSQDSDKMDVVVTNSIIADMTKEIAGDRIDLHSIVPVGRDPHDYEPLPEDIEDATEADLIFYNGLNLETGGNAWFTNLMDNADKEDGEDYFAVSEGVEPLYLEEGEDEGQQDPHAWMDLENGMTYAENIEKRLSEKDPQNADYYEENLDDYLDELKDLDEEAKEKFSDIPEDEKLLVTSEGAFKYFSQAYDVPASYIWEINTEEEGTPDQTKRVVDQLEDTNVKSLFVETSVNPSPMQSVSQDSGIPIHSEIFTDSVAEPGDEGDSYYAMMKWNIDKIYEGLTQE
ncbi:MAG: metal ABC transporter substrate-binding protein [Tetragenococcus sp.]|nr:metal ABC transporter substrate-binding protein [Tetragenococcus sp.]